MARCTPTCRAHAADLTITEQLDVDAALTTASCCQTSGSGVHGVSPGFRVLGVACDVQIRGMYSR